MKVEVHDELQAELATLQGQVLPYRGQLTKRKNLYVKPRRAFVAVGICLAQPGVVSENGKIVR